jgi:hypothetical protein
MAAMSLSSHSPFGVIANQEYGNIFQQCIRILLARDFGCQTPTFQRALQYSNFKKYQTFSKYGAKYSVSRWNVCVWAKSMRSGHTFGRRAVVATNVLLINSFCTRLKRSQHQ